MNNGRILGGIDAGHVNTKAVVMRGHEILGYGAAPTGFDVVAAAQTVLAQALKNAGIGREELAGVVSTGIFRDQVKVPPLDITKRVPEYVADAKGALFLNRNSRTVIDIGGNVHKAVRFDEEGNVLDVIQNDKCADGLGIFYTSMARALGLNEQELSELALRSARNVSVAIQCALSAEAEAIDLMCQGVDTADVANAVARFISQRVAAMSTITSPAGEIVVAGGLARSQALISHLSDLMKEELRALDNPEYVGAIGAVISVGGGK